LGGWTWRGWNLLCTAVSVAHSINIPRSTRLTRLTCVCSLERVPETGRLRFIDVSEESERAMGLKTQQETLAEYQHALLSPSHPTTKRVRDIATRIVEGNMLGHMKEGHSWKQLPNISLGSIFGTEDQQEEILGDERTKFNAAGNKDVEWEVRAVCKDYTWIDVDSSSGL
jgi:hypothetical protein